jgi:hypothetical protein
MTLSTKRVTAAVTLYYHILEELGSNLCRDTAYPE